MSSIIFIRHAETDMAGTFCGHSDPPLNARGQEQLHTLAEQLKGYNFDAIHSSDLRRAFDTASFLAATFGVPCSTSPNLREINFGQWEGLTWKQIESADPKFAQRWVDEFPHIPAPEGEPFADFEDRVLKEVEELTASPKKQRLAVVTHAGVMRVVLQNLLDYSSERAWELTRPHCSFFLYEHDDEPKRAAMTGEGIFNEADRAAVYRAIASRRDVRRGFTDRPLPGDVLNRLLAAAHSAPSVGLMQPTRFIVIRDRSIRSSIRAIFDDANRKAALHYSGAQAEQYAALKLEGILEAPQNICVVSDTGNQRGHGLGRQTMPETALYSTVCAIQNLWLAARAESVGVGWVSILDPARLREVLHIPEHIVPVAYLCVGYVDRFASEPELERFGWEKRIPLEAAICYDLYREP